MTPDPSTTSPSDPLTQGQALLNAQDFAGALRLIDEALRANPSRFLAVFERARCHLGMAKWNEAIEGFTEALRIDSTELASYLNRGTCRGNLADHEGAAEDIERFLDGNPKRGEIWWDLGDRRLDAGQYARAAEAYRKAAELLPEKAPDLAPWIERGQKLDALKSNGPKSDFAAACRERGWAKLQAGGYRTGAMWFNRSIDALPEDADAWHGRGVCRNRLGQRPEAMADLEKAITLSPDSASVWTDLGNCRNLQGDSAGALAAAEEALRRNPDSPEALFLRGLSRGKLGDFASAEADFTRCVETSPKDSISWLNRGWVRRKAGRAKEAEEDLSRSLELDPQHPLAYYHRGFARREMGDAAGSGEDFRKAMSLDPSMVAELTPLLPAQPTSAPTPAPRISASPAPAAAVRPAPSPTPSGPAEWTGKSIVVTYLILAGILALGVFRVPYLGGIPARALDFPYKAAWVVAHWTDEVAFPHECNLCMEPFCTRTDVTKKHVCGRPNYTSQTRWRYCPAHEAGLLRTDTRLDAFVMIFYMGLSLILGAITVVMAVMIPQRLILFPVITGQVLRGSQPKTAFWPFLGGEDTWLFKTDSIMVFGSLVLFAVMLVMYMIW